MQCLGRDITERRRTEAELTGGAQAGGSRQPRQVALPGGHEPRDPHADERHPRHDLAALATPSSPPSSSTYAHAIERSARTLLTLIDEILDFSKIEADKLQLNSAPLAIDECVQGVVELLAPKAYEKGIDIAWAVDPALPRPLLGDEVRAAPDRHQPASATPSSSPTAAACS